MPSSRQIKRERNAAMDGLRGLAIALVMINHAGPTLFPANLAEGTGVYAIPVLRGLFGGGAVVVFFVVGGFIVALSLLRDLDRGTMDPARFLARRIVRLGIQLSMLAAALIAVQAWDPTAPGTMEGLFHYLGHVFTYTLNIMPLAPDGVSRTDLGHLWYLSVQQQAYLVLPLFLVLVASRRILGSLALTAGIVAVYVHRQEVAETDWLGATMYTTTRSDGLLWGVLLALAIPLLQKFHHWSHVLLISVVGMLACQLSLQELGENAFLGPWSLLYQLAIGAAMVGIWLQSRPSVTSRVLSWGPFTWLGRNSLTLYFWHFPVFVFVARHGEGLQGWALALISAVALLSMALVLERFVEEPTRQWLARSKWFRPSARTTA